MITVSTDRSRLKPWGLFGGGSGGNSACCVQRPGGKVEKLQCSKMTLPLEEGAMVTLLTPGAGGWGDPFRRDPERVLPDVQKEYISVERARACYGVAIRRKGYRQYELDLDETRRLRERVFRESLAAPVS